MSHGEVYVCPTCFHHSNAYWHRLTPGLVNALVKFQRAVIYRQRNALHTYRDLEGTESQLTTVEQMNWTKLRFHGLVAKYKVDGVVQRGYWVLTRRGAEFLRGARSVPVTVKTLNNHVIERSDELVTIQDVRGSLPSFDDISRIEQERQAIDTLQLSLI